MPYVYVFVRTDIPLADQLVQAAHACLEAGYRFPQPEKVCHMVVCAVSSEERLHRAVEQVEPIRAAMFFEPDDEMGWTAACTEPVYGSARDCFRRFKLWEPRLE